MDLRTHGFFRDEDPGTVLAVVANLMAEVATLQERVRELEPDAAVGDDGAQERFDDLVERVMSPLIGDPDLP